MGAIFEDVPQVSMASRTQDFRADHAMLTISLLCDRFLADGLPEAGPSRPGIVFGLRTEQRLMAADAVIGAMGFVVPISPSKSPFSAFFPSNKELFFA